MAGGELGGDRAGAAGQRAGWLVPAGRVAQPADQLPGPVPGRDLVCGLEVPDVLVHGERVVQHHRLRAVAQPAMGQHAARIRPEVTSQDAQQRGLAAPVLADHGGHLTRLDGQVNPGQHPAVTE